MPSTMAANDAQTLERMPRNISLGSTRIDSKNARPVPYQMR
ncbi:MAG: hypothetical protein K0S05_3373 [Agromyces sp.]|nr:hypothetical protein [Agromyces sp.]